MRTLWNIDKVKNQLKKDKEGYKCLSDIYINSKTKLKLMCPKGHIFYMLWPIYKQNHRCPICGGKKKKSIEEVSIYIQKFNYKCLSTKYLGSEGRLLVRCNKGHIYKTCWHNFQKGSRCPKCYLANVSNLLKKIKSKIKKPEKELKSIYHYRTRVMEVSNSNFYKHYYSINPLNLKRGKDYHLDHMYSIIDGYDNHVKIRIMASPVNLRIISSSHNLRKQRKSCITLDKLYKEYYKFQRRK